MLGPRHDAQDVRGALPHGHPEAHRLLDEVGVAVQGRGGDVEDLGRARKGDFRRLWIQRINAAVRDNGMTYNRFIQGLKIAEIEVDRRMLAELAVHDEAAFVALVDLARANVPAEGEKADSAA